MKKYFLVVFCATLFFVTGCGKKNQVVCSGTTNDLGIEVKAELIADFDSDDKLTDATIVYDLGNSDTANQWCSMFQLMNDDEKGIKVSCSGSKITIKGYASMTDSEDDEEKVIGKTKEEFKKLMETESNGELTCK